MRCSIFKRELSSPSLSAPSLTIQTPQHRPGGAEQPTQLHRHTAAQLSGQVDDALCHARRAAARRARSAAGRAAPATSLSGCNPHTLAPAGKRSGKGPFGRSCASKAEDTEILHIDPNTPIERQFLKFEPGPEMSRARHMFAAVPLKLRI